MSLETGMLLLHKHGHDCMLVSVPSPLMESLSDHTLSLPLPTSPLFPSTSDHPPLTIQPPTIHLAPSTSDPPPPSTSPYPQSYLFSFLSLSLILPFPAHRTHCTAR